MIPKSIIDVQIPYMQPPHVELARASGYIRSWDWQSRGLGGIASANMNIFMFNANKDSRLCIALSQFRHGCSALQTDREVELVLRAPTCDGGIPGTRDLLDIASIEVFPRRVTLRAGSPERPWMITAPNVWELQLNSNLGIQEVCFPDDFYRGYGVHMDLDTILKVCSRSLELILRYAHPLPDVLQPKEHTVKTSHTFEVYFETEHASNVTTQSTGVRLRQAIYDKLNKKTVDGAITITSLSTTLKEEKLMKPESWKDVFDGSKLAAYSCNTIRLQALESGYEFYNVGGSVYRTAPNCSECICQVSDLK